MSPEEFHVQSAVRYFIHNWLCGLQPELSVKTSLDGTLSINVNVQCSPASHYSTPRRKRSGRGSRRRRMKQRACNSTDESLYGNYVASKDSTLLERSIAVEEAATVDTVHCVPSADLQHDEICTNSDFDMEMQQLSTSHSISDQNLESICVPPDDRFGSYNGEVIVGDLIQLDDSLPIVSEQVFQKDISATARSSQLPGSLSSPVQPQFEVMMYNMVRELYTRTCGQDARY